MILLVMILSIPVFFTLWFVCTAGFMATGLPGQLCVFLGFVSALGLMAGVTRLVLRPLSRRNLDHKKAHRDDIYPGRFH